MLLQIECTDGIKASYETGSRVVFAKIPSDLGYITYKLGTACL